MKTSKLRIEHSGNSVYAILTEDGPAVYPTLDDATTAIRSDSVEVHEGDADYYEGREWLPVEDETTQIFAYDTNLSGYKVVESADRDHSVNGDDLALLTKDGVAYEFMNGRINKIESGTIYSFRSPNDYTVVAGEWVKN